MGLRGPLPKTIAEVWKELLAEAKQDGECLLIERGHSTGIGYRRRRADYKEWYIHQIADQMARGPVPEGTVLMHSCDRPNCINPDHIKRGTHTLNAIDKFRKQRHMFGERHYRTRLTVDKVREIREAQGSYTELSKRFGISRGGIHNIKSGRSWRLLR